MTMQTKEVRHTLAVLAITPKRSPCARHSYREIQLDGIECHHKVVNVERKHVERHG